MSKLHPLKDMRIRIRTKETKNTDHYPRIKKTLNKICLSTGHFFYIRIRSPSESGSTRQNCIVPGSSGGAGGKHQRVRREKACPNPISKPYISNDRPDILLYISSGLSKLSFHSDDLNLTFDGVFLPLVLMEVIE